MKVNVFGMLIKLMAISAVSNFVLLSAAPLSDKLSQEIEITPALASSSNERNSKEGEPTTASAPSSENASVEGSDTMPPLVFPSDEGKILPSNETLLKILQNSSSQGVKSSEETKLINSSSLENLEITSPLPDSAPKSGENPRTSGETLRTSGETVPKSGENPRTSGEISQKSGEFPTTSGETVPKSGENPTTSGEIAPKSDENPRTSGEIAPKSDENPRTSGEIAPKSGENPTTSGETAPKSDENPRTSGEIAPKSDENPRTSGEIVPKSDENPRTSGEIVPTSGENTNGSTNLTATTELAEDDYENIDDTGKTDAENMQENSDQPQEELEEQFAKNGSEKATINVFEDPVTNEPAMHSSHFAIIFAVTLVILAVVGYVGLILWRGQLEARYGTRQRLVTEDVFYSDNQNDARYFGL